MRPACKIFTAEVSTAAPLAASMAAGVPTTIEYQPSWVDGIGARAVFPQMFERARSLIDGSLVADLDSIAAPCACWSNTTASSPKAPAPVP
jgi:threonine dehydratase